MLTAVTSDALSSPPDWETLGHEILCPLCDYNLRGLAEPRCPECGAAFTWADLRDPARKLHPYLFEHHPERNVRSFFLTALGGWLPWRFWRTLLPIQPSRPRRLVLYGVICTLVAMLVGLAQTANAVLEYRQQTLAARAYVATRFQAAGVAADAWAMDKLRQYGTATAYVDAAYPLAPKLIFFQRALRSLALGLNERFWRNPVAAVTVTLFAAILWPWLAALTFQIFQFSMRRVRVRPMHVMRVAIYSSDVLPLLAVLLLVPIVADLCAMLTYVPTGILLSGYTGHTWVADAIIMAGGAAVLLITVRLYFGAKRYLRFNHPLATVLSVQIIVILTIAVLCSMMKRL